MASTAIGHAPAVVVYIYGTDGTLRLSDGGNPDAGLQPWAGPRHDERLRAVQIQPSKRGAWRVEEEFLNAIRGEEPVTRTDFVTGVGKHGVDRCGRPTLYKRERPCACRLTRCLNQPDSE